MARTMHFDRYLTIRIEDGEITTDYDEQEFDEDQRAELVRYTDWLRREHHLDTYDGTNFLGIPSEDVVADFFGSVDD